MSQTSLIKASFQIAKLNRVGNTMHKATSPHQESFQKLTLLPSPITNFAFLRITSQSFLIFVYKSVPKLFLLSPEQHPPSISSNFLLIVSLHREFLSLANRQFHFSNKALFSLYNPLTPKPPTFLSVQTMAHFTK